LLALFALAMPSFAQDLTAPRVNDMLVKDYSGFASELGYCLTVIWDAVDGAERYAVRVTGKKGAAKFQTDWVDKLDKTWRFADEVVGPQNSPNKTAVCGLKDRQKVKFRVRAVSTDSFNGKTENGPVSKTYSVKLPRFGTAPYLSRAGVPGIDVLG